MVGWLRGITWVIRLVVMYEFTVRIFVSMTMGEYGDAAWEIAVVMALCPAWDELDMKVRMTSNLESDNQPESVRGRRSLSAAYPASSAGSPPDISTTIP